MMTLSCLKQSVESIQLQLLAKFKMKDLGEFGWILDMYAE
jgi:hypothetical protein